MKIIYTAKKEEILVDDSDYEFLNSFVWYVKNHKHTSYAKTGHSGICMHRLIMGVADRNIIIDHKDHNGLNNQRSNLRIANKSQNAMNKMPNGKIPYKGVSIRSQKQKYFHKSSGEFRYANTKDSIVARIKINGKSIQIGSGYETIEEAALAYNEAAIKYHGEFAVLNEINQ